MWKVYIIEEVCIDCNLFEVYCQPQHAKSMKLIWAFKGGHQDLCQESRWKKVGQYFSQCIDIIVMKLHVFMPALLVQFNVIKVANQVHPERSGDIGLRFYNDFIRMALNGETN